LFNLITKITPHRALLLVAMLFLLLATVLATSWGIAEVMVSQPRYLMQQWEQGKPLTTEDWQAAIDDMDLAMSLNNNNPEYSLDLARLYEWHALQQPLWTDHARTYRTHSIEHYRAATQLRPVWALAWINLAMTKTLNQQFDDEVAMAIEQAMIYGQWEHGVHKKIIWLGLATWNYLPESTQAKLLSFITKSLLAEHSVDFISDTAKRFKWQQQLNAIKLDQQLEAQQG